MARRLRDIISAWTLIHANADNLKAAAQELYGSPPHLNGDSWDPSDVDFLLSQLPPAVQATVRYRLNNPGATHQQAAIALELTSESARQYYSRGLKLLRVAAEAMHDSAFGADAKSKP